MTAVVWNMESREELLQFLHQGMRRARALGKPILASLAQPMWENANPLALFAAAEQKTPRMFWAQPNKHLWLVGVGDCSTIAIDGNHPFEEARRSHLSLLDSGLIHGPDIRAVGPIIMGGFLYDPGAPRLGIWKDFREGLLTLPRFVFAWSEGERWLTINTMLLPQGDPLEKIQEIVQQFAAMNMKTRIPTQRPRIYSNVEDTQDDWREKVNKALESIEQGHLGKIVLARKRTLYSHVRFSPELALSKLISTHPECSIFAFDRGETCFLGATPEDLVHLQDQNLSLSCLAGTAARGSNPEEDRRLEDELLNSPKERREHHAVVDMIATALDGVCYNLHWERDPQVIRLPTVQHLRTSFEGRLKIGAHILQLLERLHPTPAVCGTPTDQALRAIRELEGDRGWYAAPVGWLDPKGEGEFSVAIRSALLAGEKATLFAGAGIVKGSDPDQEFRETELKFQPLFTALADS